MPRVEDIPPGYVCPQLRLYEAAMFTDDKVSYLEWCKAKTLELVKTGKVELPLPRPPP